MRIYKELDADDYRREAWSGAVDTLNALTDDQVEQIFDMLDPNDEGMSLTELNDFFWFENDTIAEWLGYKDWEQLEARGDKGSEYFDDAIYNIKISHGATGVDDNYSIESLLDDAKEESGGEYDLLDDMGEDYDDETEQYTGSVEVWVSEAIADWLDDNGVNTESV